MNEDSQVVKNFCGSVSPTVQQRNYDMHFPEFILRSSKFIP